MFSGARPGAGSEGGRAPRCSIRRFHWPVRASLTDRTRVIDGIEQDAGEDIHVLTDCRDNEVGRHAPATDAQHVAGTGRELVNDESAASIILLTVASPKLWSNST